MALYVHLAWDGGIFVIRGDTGEQLWVDREGLWKELAAAKERGEELLYSRERGAEDPPEEVADTFDRIIGYELPMKLVAEPHPQALVDPDRRRTVTLE